ncbi:MAG TPA: ATP-binding protein, partial [Bacteroidales bacterium]|nr:hypothetical protein [Bacteroidales bacterium]HRC90256.1 ATP-binding protein [Bacteroidales bacterium]
EEGSIQILTIKLSVNKSLEPEWILFTDREMERKEISHKMREKLSILRVGNQIEKHFTWGKGSVLNKWSDNIDQARAMIADAVRKAKEGFDEDKIPDLQSIIEKISKTSEKFGIRPKTGYKAQLDTKSISFGYGAISINDDKIPVRQFGSGSKKLLASGLQVESTNEGAILLFDEIETGLEPYRLRNLIRVLKRELESKGQIIATTHSSVALVEFDAANIVIVRNNAGIINCQTLPTDIQKEFQGVFRKVPEAFFAKNVIVCEGATEYGFLLAFEEYLTGIGYDNFGYQGVTIVNGQGDTLKQICKGLTSLGYNTCVIIDSDKIKKEEIEALRKSNIKVIIWNDQVSIEERIFLDVPKELIIETINLAYGLLSDEIGEEPARQSIIDVINSKLHTSYSTFNEIVEHSDITELRKDLGIVANDKKWFKKVYKGKCLGSLVFGSFDKIKSTDIYSKMYDLIKWIYG